MTTPLTRVRRVAGTLARLPVMVAGVFVGLLWLYWWTTLRMPGRSFSGPLPPFTAEELSLAQSLEQEVRHLALDLGERNTRHPEALEAAAAWIGLQLSAMSLEVTSLPYVIDGVTVRNLEVTFPGAAPVAPIVVVGAHYDSAIGTPGANDNGSGVASLLELARRLREQRGTLELRLVWFVNEEPPYFQTRNMGSLHYARGLVQQGRSIAGMLSLETMGCYRDEPGSQQYPGAVGTFFPERGNFLAFVGDDRSGALVRRALGLFRAAVPLPSEGMATGGALQGVGWSDHWSFWQLGAPALMVTDTAPFRYQHYHRATDTPERLDYPRLARATLGLQRVIRGLLQPSQ